MGRYSSTGSYQGLPISAWSIPRKPGMTHDTGWVEMPVENIKKIDLKPQFRPWVIVRNDKAKTKEPPGPMHMGAALKILAKRPTTVAEPAPEKNEVGELFRGGALAISTTSEKAGGFSNQVVLDPMFLSPSGIREMEEDLASATLHDEGTMRLVVVDVRYWWDKYGTPVYGNYNITNKYGSFDESYFINKAPSTLGDLVKYLAFCLPGSPEVHPKSACFDAKLKPPQNIRMRFELPSVWLNRLLDAYGLELHLTRGSDIYIAKRGDKRAPQFFSISPGDGNNTQPSIPPTYEKKTVYAVDVPEGLFVAGGQRQRRITVACEPCFTNEDGQVRRLADLPRLWDGYTVEKALAQANLGHEKSFQDVPHKDGKQWHARIEIARRDFFRMYAPVWLFSSGSTATFWKKDFQKHPFMPMQDPVYSLDEFKEIASEALPLSSLQPDSADLVTLPGPLVKASVIRRDYSADLKGFQKKTEDSLRSLEAARNAIYKKILALNEELSEIIEGRPLWDAFNDSTIRSGMLRVLSKYGIIKDATALANLKEFTSAVFFGSIDQLNKELQDDADWNARRLQFETATNAAIDRMKKEGVDLAKKIQTLRRKFTEAYESIKATGFARLWVNFPYGIVPDAHVDKENGIVRFSELAAVMDYPALRDLEGASLVGDGSVEVTYMYKTDRNRPNDYAYWAFLAPPDGGEITLTEIDEPTGLKCAIEKDERLVIYERESGDPMNLGDVTEKAFRIAGNVLATKRQEDGFEYKYLGVWRFCTDEGQSEVQWTSDGDSAWTIVFVNHPDGSASGWDSFSKKKAKEELIYPWVYVDVPRIGSTNG